MRLFHVYTLSDRQGDYHLHIQCRTCMHIVSFPAKTLAERYGADTTLDRLKERFVCRCGARRPWVWAMNEPIE